MSQGKQVKGWEELKAKYSPEFIEKAIKAYVRSQEYHALRNARISKAVASAKANGTY